MKNFDQSPASAKLSVCAPFQDRETAAPILRLASELALDYASIHCPIQDVPGTYLEITAHSTKEVSFVMGDVGIADLLPVLCLQHCMRRAIALGRTEPQRLIYDLNAMLYDCCATQGCFTCFYAQYCRQTGVLRYINAGHESPLLIRRHPEEVLRLEKGGPVLGLKAGPHYRQSAIPLRRGDRLVAFTEGVLESLAQQTVASAEATLIEFIRNSTNQSAVELANLIMAKTEAIHTEVLLDRSVMTICVDAIRPAGYPSIREQTAVLARA